MSDPAYPAARIVAPRVRAHFELHEQEAKRRGRVVLAPPPDADTIEALIDVAFWASLRREETYVPKISLAFLTPGGGVAPDDVRAAAAARARRARQGGAGGGAPGHSSRRGARATSGLSVWGTVRAIPFLCFVVEVAAPGLLVVKHHRGEETGKFVNVAVIEGDQIKIVDETASSLPDCPPLLTSLLGFDSPASWSTGVDSVNVLVQLAVSMRAHGRGGLLLVVPGGRRRVAANRSCGRSRTPSCRRFPSSRNSMRESPDAKLKRPWQDAVNRAVEAIAGLTAVDGATVLTNRYELLAFGAKIARRKGLAAGRAGDGDGAGRGQRRDDGPSNAARRHASSVGGAVRPRSARRGRARGVAGRPLHGLRVVAVRGDGPRAQGRDAACFRKDSAKTPQQYRPCPVRN